MVLNFPLLTALLTLDLCQINECIQKSVISFLLNPTTGGDYVMQRRCAEWL
jgi:hypothetical protein